MKNFEKEIKSAESNSNSNDLSNENNEFKAHLTHVKSKYQKLIKLSNLYSQRLDFLEIHFCSIKIFIFFPILISYSFTHLENLSKLIDEFTVNITRIEQQLAAQSFIDILNLDSNKLAKESEHLQVNICCFFFA